MNFQISVASPNLNIVHYTKRSPQDLYSRALVLSFRWLQIKFVAPPSQKVSLGKTRYKILKIKTPIYTINCPNIFKKFFVCWLTEKSVESLILTTTKPMPLSCFKRLAYCCDYISCILNLGLPTSCSSEEVVLNHEIYLELYICLSCQESFI